MAGANLGPIYDRLNGTKQYHPFSAKTFADWSSEAGDTVQISREGTTYSSPIHKQSLVWRGKHMINMESTGTRERTPIERMSNRKENETSAGMSAGRGYGGGAGRTLEALHYDFYSEDGAYQSQLHMDEQRFTTIFAKTGIEGLPAGTTLATMINQTAEAITLEAIRAQENESQLSGKITVEAGRISQVVTAVGKDGKVTAASICLAINQSGESQAVINANKIYLLGQTIAQTITADYVKTKISQINMINAHAITCDGLLSAGGGLYVLGKNCSSLPSGVKSVRLNPSGNTCTLQYTTYENSSWQDSGSFSRAISGWSVGGGGGSVNVTANPQGQTKSVPITVSGPISITSNGSYTYTAMFENSSGDDVSTGATRAVTVDVPIPATPTPSSARISSYASGTSLGAVSGASPGKHVLFNLGSTVYDILLT